MFISKKWYRALSEELHHLSEYNKKEENNYKRIKESKIIFENVGDIKNLYVDDRLETGFEVVLYDSQTAIENGMTWRMSKEETKRIPGLSIIGFLELDWWDEQEGYIKVSKLFISQKYRRRGYATKLLQRLLEFAEFNNVKKVELTACAGDGIEQWQLEELYQNCGFKKVSERSNRMIYDFQQ